VDGAPDAGEVTAWAVLRDERGGIDWREMVLRVAAR
jgi:hypothetical protein